MTTSSTSQPSTSFPPPTPRTTITLRGPGEIIAAVPYLLGFHPRDSVVLVAHAGRSPSARGPGADRADVGHVLRMDIPPEDMVVELRADLEATLRPSLAEATAVTVVIVGGAAEPGGGPAHQALMTELASLLTAVGVPIARALWTPEITKGAPWCDYARSDSAGSGPADRDGVVPDPWASTLAAASAHAGHITYPSREAMERSLESDDPELLMRRSALLELAASRDEVERGDGRSGTDDVGAERIVEAVGVVRDALGRFRRGLRESAACVLSDQQVVDLARALSRHDVRDMCLGEAWPAGTPRALAAERLWRVLVRATPDPERAEPAALLAYSAYLRGEGALASMAVAKARQADPGHLLATLLEQVVARGMPPEQLAGLAQSYAAPDLLGTASGGDDATRGGPA